MPRGEHQSGDAKRNVMGIVRGCLKSLGCPPRLWKKAAEKKKKKNIGNDGTGWFGGRGKVPREGQKIVIASWR